MKITPKERAVIEAVAESQYRDGCPLDVPVWSWGLDAEGVTSRGMGGVFASLQKKGLVELAGEGEDATVWLTGRGISVYNEGRK